MAAETKDAGHASANAPHASCSRFIQHSNIARTAGARPVDRSKYNPGQAARKKRQPMSLKVKKNAHRRHHIGLAQRIPPLVRAGISACQAAAVARHNRLRRCLKPINGASHTRPAEPEPGREPTYPFSAQHLAAVAKRKSQGVGRQQAIEWAVRFYVVFWQL